MSTHTTFENRHESPVETTIDPEGESESTDDTTAQSGSAAAHYAAATFDTENTLRLPNTVDDENKRVG